MMSYFTFHINMKISSGSKKKIYHEKYNKKNTGHQNGNISSNGKMLQRHKRIEPLQYM